MTFVGACVAERRARCTLSRVTDSVQRLYRLFLKEKVKLHQRLMYSCMHNENSFLLVCLYSDHTCTVYSMEEVYANVS